MKECSRFLMPFYPIIPPVIAYIKYLSKDNFIVLIPSVFICVYINGKKNETSSELMLISPFTKFSALSRTSAFKKKIYVSDCVYSNFSEENEEMKLAILDC